MPDNLTFDRVDNLWIRFLFVSIQHPAEGSTLGSLSSHFPDGSELRPSVVVVENTGGARVMGS